MAKKKTATRSRTRTSSRPSEVVGKKSTRSSKVAKRAAKVAVKNAKEKNPQKTSALEAAAKVLASSKVAMTTKEMIEAMAEKKLWSSPGGKTPDRTLYSAILREIATKGNDARFKKTERGKFALAVK